MGTSEKFCLRWNDFETNISVAFRELREEKDFFDVTLACDDSSQIQAHKVILSACSPFFRNVLRKNPHQHPLLYLKGVKYKEMLSVLNFMYMGEVNVAQEELNSFLAVAEDLRVKGLTQNNAESGDKTKAESKSNSNRNREPPEREPGPPPKRARPVPSAPSTPAPTNNRPSSYEDDDIQEVVPVKSEPRDVTTPSTAMTTSSNNDYQDSSLVEPGQGQVALEDSYQDDSYDYGNYEEGYDDGSGMIDPNTGMPIAAGADGNKESVPWDEDISTKLGKLEGQWTCFVCEYTSKYKSHVIEHVEAKHVDHPPYICGICGKNFKARNGYRQHFVKYHKLSLEFFSIQY
ncbi:protein tramtrack, beta isoform isoform X11 [Eurytemora carolleeae]|uniref:protein tramtrack, beta isoform isoform X11 n=1 Tax=Eurytemora carolleeae TaxID=1294199 RepID=UPI000C7661D0|nr:protein tramtrack, beta isoform isoform X11 [Eurytemora carolleeae]|eukprot:XP_023319847.1 protein tramtrack, beta isoform-like isoform X11 [Eurytemora affinis]